VRLGDSEPDSLISLKIQRSGRVGSAPCAPEKCRGNIGKCCYGFVTGGFGFWNFCPQLPRPAGKLSPDLRDFPPLLSPFALSAWTLQRLRQRRALSAQRFRRPLEARALGNERFRRLRRACALRKDRFRRLREGLAMSARRWRRVRRARALGNGTFRRLRNVRALSTCRLRRLRNPRALSAQRLRSVRWWFVPNRIRLGRSGRSYFPHAQAARPAVCLRRSVSDAVDRAEAISKPPFEVRSHAGIRNFAGILSLRQAVAVQRLDHA
jgi:hypothetical protein